MLLSEPHPIRNARDAEQAACLYMIALGYSDAALTSAGADGGIDVIAEGAVGQVKAHVKPVGSPDIQQLFGVASALQARPLFFALSGYSAAASAFAADNGICLFTFDLMGVVQPSNSFAQALEDIASMQGLNDYEDAFFVPEAPGPVAHQSWIVDAEPSDLPPVYSSTHVLLRGEDSVQVLDVVGGITTWFEYLPSSRNEVSTSTLVGDVVLVALTHILRLEHGMTSRYSKVIALDANTRDELWRQDFSGGISFCDSHHESGRAVLLHQPFLQPSQVINLDARLGSACWVTNVDESVETIYFPRFCGSDVVFGFSSASGQFVERLDGRTGFPQSGARVADTPLDTRQSLTIFRYANPALYVLSGAIGRSSLHRISKTGQIEWTSSSTVRDAVDLEVVAGVVISIEENSVTAFDCDSGQQSWKRDGVFMWAREYRGKVLLCEATGGSDYFLTVMDPESGKELASFHADGNDNFLPSVRPMLIDTQTSLVLLTGRNGLFGRFKLPHLL